MDARDVLAKLRSGEPLGSDDVTWFASAMAQGDVDDAQIGAFSMGICRAPMTLEVRVALTLAMRDSGSVLNWDLPGPVLDKHSTGGVGDPISLILGPAIASLGAFMPMLSGRGLGHSGGTLDKLEAIPGLSTELSAERFQEVVAQAGFGVVSAGSEIAPADRRLYSIRDITATVESIDLITASILSKKLAGGVGPLVLDVKVGSGAFMASLPEAEALARSLVETANGAAGPAAAVITDMNQPCVESVGNALELMEVMEILTDPDPDEDAERLTATLGGTLLCLGGMADTQEEGHAQIINALKSGQAAERFGRMVAAKGGPSDFVERWRDRLPAAPIVREVVAPMSGSIAGMNGRALGTAVVQLGGGRRKTDDKIDPSVGLSDVVRIGDHVQAGDPLAIVHGRNEADTEAVALALVKSFVLSQDPVYPPDLIRKVIS